MTIKDMRELAAITNGSGLTPESLARHLLAANREMRLLREERDSLYVQRETLKADLRKAKYGRKTEADLKRALEAKQHALDFAVRRNEVLKRQVNGG